MHRIATTEHASLGVDGGMGLVDVPDRGAVHVELEVRVTDEEAHRIQLLLERKLAPEEMATRSGGGKGEQKSDRRTAVQQCRPDWLHANRRDGEAAY